MDTEGRKMTNDELSVFCKSTLLMLIDILDIAGVVWRNTGRDSELEAIVECAMTKTNDNFRAAIELAKEIKYKIERSSGGAICALRPKVPICPMAHVCEYQGMIVMAIFDGENCHVSVCYGILAK